MAYVAMDFFLGHISLQARNGSELGQWQVGGCSGTCLSVVISLSLTYTHFAP